MKTETLTSMINQEMSNLRLDFYKPNGNGIGGLEFTFQSVAQVSANMIILQGRSQVDFNRPYNSSLRIRYNSNNNSWDISECKYYNSGVTRILSSNLQVSFEKREILNQLFTLIQNYWQSCSEEE